MFKDNFITICRSNHLALKTERAYWHHARRYIAWLGAKSVKDLEQDPTGNFRKYLSAMANQHPDREEGNEGVSASTQNGNFHALRFLYEKVVGIQLGDLSKIPRAIAHQRIVDVPPMETALQIVKSVNGKTGLALRLILGTAGRLNDITRIRVKDLDFRKKLIAIQESKGGKSRLVPMPESLIPELKSIVSERIKIHESDVNSGLGWVSMPGLLAKKYPEDQKSIGWQFLFCADHVSKDPVTGNFGRQHLMDVTLQRAFLLAKRSLRIKKKFTIRSLRFSMARQWAKEGKSFRQIHEWLGYSQTENTEKIIGQKHLKNLA